MSEKAIAVLTSGGDAPGMNAAVRSVVRTTATPFSLRMLAIAKEKTNERVAWQRPW